MRPFWISLLIVACCLSSAWAEDTLKAVRAIDGDKLILNNGWQVRLYGIDAPDPGQPLYKQAAMHLARLVNNAPLELDCYQHLYQWRVCLVTSNDLDLSYEMVRAGMAYDYPKFSNGMYADAQQEAMDAKRGVWALEGGGLRPWEFRNYESGKNR